MAPSFDWWAKEGHKGTPVVVKMENPNWSMVELEGPSDEDFLIGSGDSSNHHRNKNAKKLTWVLLLALHFWAALCEEDREVIIVNTKKLT